MHKLEQLETEQPAENVQRTLRICYAILMASVTYAGKYQVCMLVVMHLHLPQFVTQTPQLLELTIRQ